MGQEVATDENTLAAINAGDYVGVSGGLAGNGRLSANNVYKFSEKYVPGASTVFVTGLPTAVDASRGVASIGSLDIDYTSTLGNDRYGGIGAAITVIGTQPTVGGLMLSDRVVDATTMFFER